jgi:hypothetical protein
VLVLAGGIAAGVGLWTRPLEASVVGVIGDSRCGASHDDVVGRDVNDHDCVLGCVARGAAFVLIADGRVYQIRNQELPTLRTFAAARVKVSGQLHGESITVAALAPANLR